MEEKKQGTRYPSNKKRQDEKTTTFDCGVCKKLLCSKLSLKLHVQRHIESSVDESTCSTVRKSQTGACAESKALACVFCGKLISSKFSLKMHEQRHIRETQSKSRLPGIGNKTFSCYLCGKFLSSKCSLKKHINSDCGIKRIKRRCTKSTKSIQTDARDECETFTCDFCRKVLPSKRSLNMHIQRHFEMRKSTIGCFSNGKSKSGARNGGKTFVCDCCGKVLYSKASFWSHKHRHTSVYKYYCQICNKGFFSKHELKQHRGKHLSMSEKHHVCNICNKRFHCDRFLKKHKEVHSEYVRYKCQTCSKLFKTYYRLFNHVKTHRGNDYSCFHCNKSFNNFVVLKRHVAGHFKASFYSCKVCRKQFVQSINLAKHVAERVCERTFYCGVCQRQFLNANNLKQHMSRHIKKKTGSKHLIDLDEEQKCNTNSKDLSQKHNLNLDIHNSKEVNFKSCHVCRRYTPQSNFKKQLSNQCDSCFVGEKSFNKLSDILVNKGFSDAPQNQEYTIACQRISEKHFICHICGITLRSKSAFNRHMLLNERKTSCSCEACSESFTNLHALRIHKEVNHCHVCKKSFPTHSSWLNHNLKHTKEYICGICNKSFLWQGKLSKHMSMHIEKDLLQCDICNQTFRGLHLLEKHKKTHLCTKTAPCDKCNRTFKNLSSLEKHKLICARTVVYKCDICKKETKSLDTFEKHKSSHINEKTCQICNKRLKGQENFEQHMARHMVKCGDCNKLFWDRESLKKHEEIHKMFPCEICHERFFSFTKLYKHLRKH